MRDFIVNRLIGEGELFGKYKIITLVLLALMAYVALSTYIPRLTENLKRTHRCHAAKTKAEKYQANLKAYVYTKQRFALLTKLYALPSVLTTALLAVFLVSIEVIPVGIENLPYGTLFSVSGVALLVMLLVYVIIHFSYQFTDLSEKFLPTYLDMLPPDYHTVVTTSYEKWEDEASWTATGSSSRTVDRNSTENFGRGIMNILSTLFSVLLFLLYAIFNYFDSTLSLIYHLITLPRASRPLLRAEELYRSEIDRLADERTLYEIHRLGNMLFVYDYENPTFDKLFLKKYEKELYSRARAEIESKRGGTLVAYKRDDEYSRKTPGYEHQGFFAHRLGEFIAEYKVGKSTAYLYLTHRGLVEFEIFEKPDKEEICSWVWETFVPFYPSEKNLADFNLSPDHYYKKIARAEYYYLKHLVDRGKENQKVKLLYKSGKTITQITVAPKELLLNARSKTFAYGLDAVL